MRSEGCFTPTGLSRGLTLYDVGGSIVMKCYWVSIKTRTRNGVVSYSFLLVPSGVCFANDGIPLKSHESSFQGHRRE